MITPCRRGRGRRSISPGSAGSRDSASAGRVSVPRSMARICMTVSGSGIAPPASAKTRNGKTSGTASGEYVADELADVVVDSPSRLDGGRDRGKVVVGKHHGGGLPRHVGARAPHRHPDVGPAQRRSVVHTVTGHG